MQLIATADNIEMRNVDELLDAMEIVVFREFIMDSVIRLPCVADYPDRSFVSTDINNNQLRIVW